MAEADRKKLEEVENSAKHTESLAKKLKRETIVTGQVRGFVDFLREQSVVGLAIGLVIGTQAKALVDQFMTSFVNPLIGLMLPGKGTLDQKVILVSFDSKVASFGWGAFLVSLITFVIVAMIIYYTFKGLGLDKLAKKKDS